MMFEKLRMFISGLKRGHSEVFCIHCKAHRKVIRMSVSEFTNSKNTSSRLTGKCLTCGNTTSTFIAA